MIMFIVNSILGLAAFNGVAFLVATLRHDPFQFNVILGLVSPIAAAWLSAMVPTRKERAGRL